MNRESLYLELGSIDDDLILEAADARGADKHRTNFVRVLSAAACLCLICTAGHLALRRDVVYFNAGDAPIASKLVVPMDENTTVLTMTEKALLAYYGLAQLPDTLAGLYRAGQSQYSLYRDAENVICDTNVLRYHAAGGEQTLTITLTKAEPGEDSRSKGEKRSRIDGVSVMLAADERAASVYWAELSCRDVYLRIVANGMDEPQFVDAVRALIRSQK